ncbi:MAG: DUF5017 domain-containing protein [Pedobacter sp.]|uniref:DUF5017 domain-containing protein n=1 Tax=Pedobacter sp. TaxID=1411316 RepID=UPI002806ED6D|nr:DUF5017 domain-containing protein [Pedobacter sp.]MDQ8005883.1 DUF5017 domain-containing protein [Pedobacter sp.]
MKKIYYLLVLSLGLASCAKEEVIAPSFDVSAKSLTYKVGDTINFNFNGQADILTFWSGEDGRNYDNRERTILTGGVVRMSFTSNVQFGQQVRNLQVYLSNDFTGQYTTTGVESATWIDLTDRFTYGTTTTSVNSGNIDISDVLKPGTPFYIGFKYDGQPVTGTNTQRTWTVNALNINNTFPSGNVSQLMTQATAGYLFVNILNPNNFWAFNGNAIIFRPASSTIASLDWAITSPIIADRTKPDVGAGIKSFADNKLESYSYVYTKAGTYKVVFVASNATVSGQKTVLKELNITIQP